MRGNPHAEAVNTGIQNVRELIGKREMYQRDGLGLILEAQSRMAVAHEVRTRNIIEMLGRTPDDETYNDMLREVMGRLGR